MDQAGFARIDAALSDGVPLRFAINRWSLGPEVARRCGLSPEHFDEAGPRLLEKLGVDPLEVVAAERYVHGAGRLDDCEILSPELRAVFADPAPEARLAMAEACEDVLEGTASLSWRFQDRARLRSWAPDRLQRPSRSDRPFHPP